MKIVQQSSRPATAEWYATANCVLPNCRHSTLDCCWFQIPTIDNECESINQSINKNTFTKLHGAICRKRM